MDSHEEKVYNAVRQTQERDAKIKMREKAKVPPEAPDTLIMILHLQELQRAKLETGRGGQGGVKKAGGMSSYGGQVSRKRWKRLSTLSSPRPPGWLQLWAEQRADSSGATATGLLRTGQEDDQQGRTYPAGLVDWS